MPIFTSKNKTGNRSVNFAFVEGIATIGTGVAVNATLIPSSRKLEIKMRMNKAEPYYLSVDKITNVGIIAEKEILESSKSVTGRAIVGGILLGGLGAVIGGMSGIGTTQKETAKYYFIINYHSNDEDKAISFEIVGATMGEYKLMDEIKALLPSEIPPSREL